MLKKDEGSNKGKGDSSWTDPAADEEQSMKSTKLKRAQEGKASPKKATEGKEREKEKEGGRGEAEARIRSSPIAGDGG